EMISRAYLKMAEALAWSSLPLVKGDWVVELGCAPGGASQALLDAGLKVLGVDPAEVDEALLKNPRFTHIRRRTKQLPKTALADAQWLCVDMNVAPKFTLDAVEDVVRHKAPKVRGMLITLKLPNWEVLDEIPQFIARIQEWGYRDVRVRQLAFNRQEICLAVLKTRGQRRMLRERSGRRYRVEPAHAAPPSPHVL
ncbi:MAG: hypothetical protein KDA61_10890, partial [Planctomycetales bacterium]|nr:hypothetical protein [Planctomycetales bacterium]